MNIEYAAPEGINGSGLSQAQPQAQQLGFSFAPGMVQKSQFSFGASQPGQTQSIGFAQAQHFSFFGQTLPSRMQQVYSEMQPTQVQQTSQAGAGTQFSGFFGAQSQAGQGFSWNNSSLQQQSFWGGSNHNASQPTQVSSGLEPTGVTNCSEDTNRCVACEFSIGPACCHRKHYDVQHVRFAATRSRTFIHKAREEAGAEEESDAESSVHLSDDEEDEDYKPEFYTNQSV